MSDDIHPVPRVTAGSVPTTIDPAPHRRPPYRRPPGRLRRVAAAVAVGLALVAGGVAVAQIPLHDSHVGSVFSATQNPDDDSNTAEPEEPTRQHAGVARADDDD